LIAAIVLLLVFCIAGIGWDRSIVPVMSGTSWLSTVTVGGGQEGGWVTDLSLTARQLMGTTRENLLTTSAFHYPCHNSQQVCPTSHK